MAADICVAVPKYSHATGVKPDNTIPWTHITSSNVFLVLKGEDTHIQNGHLFLQVVQANTVLETIRISELVDRSIDARRGSQQAGITPQIEQLPIFGIHKEVFLALRYRLPDNQARRVQFRLHSAEECGHVVGILERRGMEFQQQRPRTGRPSSARQDTVRTYMRPSTTQTFAAKGALGAHVDHPKLSPFRLQALEAGGLSSGSSKDTARAGGAHELGLSPSHQALSDINGQDSSSLTYGRPESYAANHMESRALSPELERPMSRLSSGLDSHAIHTHQYTTATERDSAGHGHVLTKNNAALFPPSAPVSSRLPETLEHEMPPRRELPFKRPDSHQSTGSRPSTSAKSVSHSATAGGSSEPNVVTSTLSPPRNASIGRPVTASPLKRAMSPSYEDPVKKSFAVEAMPRSQASRLATVSSPSKSTYITASEGSFRRPSDLGELLRSTRPLAERSPNSSKVTRMDSTADASFELETPPGTSSSRTKPTAHLGPFSPSRADVRGLTSPDKSDIHSLPVSQVRRKDTIATALSNVDAPPRSTGASALADYAAQSREDRQTLMDEFMVTKLEDPNFAILCEDLDSCWRRIALGL